MDVFRKKFTLTLLIFAFGSALSWKTGANLESYTVFASFLLGIFGSQDLVDKKMVNK